MSDYLTEIDTPRAHLLIKINSMDKNITLLLLITVILISCTQKNDRQLEADNLVNEWVGKEGKRYSQVEVVNKNIQLNHIKIGIKQKMTFILKNSGAIPLIISEIKTSCGCTNANWEKQPIVQGESTNVKADITIENAGYFKKTLSVYCNVEDSPLILTIKGNTE
jgi:hypothetical protein